MRISREEFKEFIALYKEAWDKFMKYGDIIDENFLDSLLFPTLHWVSVKTGLASAEDADVHDYYDIANDLVVDGHVAIKWITLEDGSCVDIEYTSDLDEIYDKYLNE